MLQTVNLKQDNIAGIRISGDVTGDKAYAFISKIMDMLDEYEKIRLYIEFDSIESLSWEAMKAEWRLKSQLARLIDFEKVAYVSDSTLADISSFMADLFPGIEARSYTLDEREQATDWIRS